MSNVSNPVPNGSHIPHVDTINLTLRIAKANGGFSVTFENFVPLPGDGPLDIRIYNNSLVALTLDTGNCDWEFDQNTAVTLGTPGTPGARYYNLALTRNANQRYVKATFEAAYLNISMANSDPYSMNFIVYNDPVTGLPYSPPR